MAKHEQRGRDVRRATSDTGRNPTHGGPQTGSGAYPIGRKPQAKEVVIDGGSGLLPAWMTRRG